MNQLEQDSAITPLIGEPTNVIPFSSYRHSRAESQTRPDITVTTYISPTDPANFPFRQPPTHRFAPERSFGALTPSDRSILDLAFGRISQALQTDLQMAETSNCFDEWKDILEAASRTIQSFTSNHRKILGTLLPLIKKRDISDFVIDTLRTFREATNLLRMPRTSKQDVRRIITELLKQKKKIMMPLDIGDSGKDEAHNLDNMMDQLILKSRSDH